MRALPPLSALTLLVTEDFLVMCFCYICVYVPTEQMGSSVKASSLHLEGARFEPQVDCYVQFFRRSRRILLKSWLKFLNFVSRPKTKNTKRFGAWICSILQVESGNGENIQAGSLEKLVSVQGHKNSRRRTYFRNVTSHLREITVSTVEISIFVKHLQL
jgi:hypothetical protein